MSEVVPRQGFISIGCKMFDSGALKKLSILNFFQIPSTLCRRVWSKTIKLDLSNFIHVLTEV